MRIKVLSGGRKNIELPLSDAELNFQMRRIGIEETVPMCRLVEVSENLLHFDRLLQSCVVGCGLRNRKTNNYIRRDCYEG